MTSFHPIYSATKVLRGDGREWSMSVYMKYMQYWSVYINLKADNDDVQQPSD